MLLKLTEKLSRYDFRPFRFTALLHLMTLINRNTEYLGSTLGKAKKLFEINK